MFYPSCHRFRRLSSGFSLVEVAIATAIIGIALATLMALIPSGATQFNQAMDTSITAQIGQRIIADAQQAEFDALIDRAALPADPLGNGYCPAEYTFRGPKVNAPEWRYFDLQGLEVRPKIANQLTEEERQRVIYYANTRIRPRAALPNSAESATQMAQITVQVVRNPAHLVLPFDPGRADDSTRPERNLITPGQVSIFTYAAIIGRNNGR